MDKTIEAAIADVSSKILTWSNPDLSDAQRLTKDWPLVDLQSALIVVAAYLLFVCVGTVLVKLICGSKEPPSFKGSVIEKFKREPILIIAAIYNLTQVLLCGYMIAGAVQEYIKAGYKPICNAFDPTKLGMASVLWVFYVSKVLDFMDTILIVLRRKWRQLSFLHLYHHFSIFLFYWLNINAGYDGDIYYTIILNSFIHLVMYTYYEATTFNITVPKLFKMMVTNMQRLQFITMNIQAIYILAMGCPYPHRITAMYLFYIISLFILFTNFSNEEYGKRLAEKPKKP